MHVPGPLSEKATEEFFLGLLQAPVLDRHLHVGPQASIVTDGPLKVLTGLTHHLQVADWQVVKYDRQDLHR